MSVKYFSNVMSVSAKCKNSLEPYHAHVSTMSETCNNNVISPMFVHFSQTWYGNVTLSYY